MRARARVRACVCMRQFVSVSARVHVCVCVCACRGCGPAEDRGATGGASEDVRHVLHPHTARGKTEPLALQYPVPSCLWPHNRFCFTCFCCDNLFSLRLPWALTSVCTPAALHTLAYTYPAAAGLCSQRYAPLAARQSFATASSSGPPSLLSRTSRFGCVRMSVDILGTS